MFISVLFIIVLMLLTCTSSYYLVKLNDFEKSYNLFGVLFLNALTYIPLLIAALCAHNLNGAFACIVSGLILLFTISIYIGNSSKVGNLSILKQYGLDVVRNNVFVKTLMIPHNAAVLVGGMLVNSF